VENAYDNDLLRVYVGKKYVYPELTKQIGSVASNVEVR
jgi:hypothetical protein